MSQRDRTTVQGDSFSDRVMAAIALMPRPTTTRSFLEAVRTGDLRDAAAVVSVAWHLGTERGWPVGPRVRARSLALVIAVATVLATGSMVAASAVRVIVPHVERPKILTQNRSAIVDAVPDPVEGVDPGRGHSTPIPVAVPVVVEVSKPTPAPVHRTEGARQGPARSAPPTKGAPSTPVRPPTGGNAGSPADGSDDGAGSDAADQGHDSSDGDGHDQGDDGTTAGGDAGGHDGNDQGDSGSGNGDGDQAHEDGGTSGD